MARLLFEITPHAHAQAFSTEKFSLPLKYGLDAVIAESPKAKKRVRFSSANTRVINSVTEYYTDEDIAARWWSSNELVDVKKNAKLMSAAIRRQSASDEQCPIAVAHRKTTLMLASDFKGLVKLSPSTPDQDLANWCRSEDGRRGLERFSSRDYCSFRRMDVASTRHAVLAEQERQLESAIVDDNAIAQVYRSASRRARTFALFLGEADSIEARQARGVPSGRRGTTNSCEPMLSIQQSGSTTAAA